jgi:hypothetical protein
MDKVYYEIDWQNSPSTATSLGRTNLRKVDVALNTIDNRVVAMDTSKANQSTMNGVVQSITFNESTGVLTITKVNGTNTTIDTKLEKLAVNFVYNPETQQLDITLDDGTVQHVDMSALVTQYEFEDTDTVSFSVESDGTIKAGIILGSITGEYLQPDYLADIIVQANISVANANLSKRYAVGGVETGDDTDNAKFYKERAEEAAAEAEAIAGFNPLDYYNKTEIDAAVGDRSLLPTPNADLVESINEISVKVIKSVKDYGAKGDGVSDDTTAIQSAIDAISPYIWQGSAGSTTHAVKYGSLGFPKGVYRITSKLKINAGIKFVGVGIEKGSDWNTRETQASCIFVDYDNESDFAFDTCPYNTAGVRVNNYLGTGADVNDGLHSTCEGIEFHNMTFYTNKTVRGFNMALSPSFIMNNCFVKGFTLSIRFSATWYSSIINTTMISRWRGISATNSTNNLNLYNVGIALAPDLPSYVSTLNDGCEYDLSFKASCGITGNYIGINAYGLTIEWFSDMINLGNSTGELYGIWTEQITSTLIYSYYSNLDISFNNIHCQMADVLNVVDSNLRITSLSRDYNYSKITGWLDATDVPKVTLTGFKPKAADGVHMNDRALRSVFTDNLNNKSTKALIYVDSVDGNDINFGDTESRSLKTLKAAIKYSQELGKQVSILLKSGQTFDIDYTSISTNDLVISSFGSGSKPIINFSYEYSGISFNIPKAFITFKNLTINNYGAKNDGYRGIASMSVRGVLNVEFIDCFINLATNSHVVGAQANGSYLANIIYENCTIDGYGETKTYGRLSYDIYRDAGDINAWNDIAINEYAFHTTKNALILGYGVANIMQKIHSTLDP